MIFENKLWSWPRVVKDGLFAGIFFVFWTWILRPYVPLLDPVWNLVGSMFTAVCLTGVTWLVWNMFVIVWRHEQNKKAGRD